MLYARYKAQTLTRKDIYLNPIWTICDLPWLFLTLITAVIAPWRLVTTYYYLSQVHRHFPLVDVKSIRIDLIAYTLMEGIFDYLMLPLYLIGAINLWHWTSIFKLIWAPHAPDYQELKNVSIHESLRKTGVWIVASKTISDIWNYLILFPLNMASLYYLPLLIHLIQQKKMLVKKIDTGKLKKELSTFMRAAERFDITSIALDYKIP